MQLHGYSKGFSLIELIVVLFIVISVVSISTPNFLKSVELLKTKSMLRSMMSDIRSVRLHAIKTGKSQTWTIDLEEHQYWTSFNQKRHSYARDMSVEFTTASKELLSAKTAALRFFPNGGSTGARLALDRKGSHYVLEVDWLTGLVRINE